MFALLDKRHSMLVGITLAVDVSRMMPVVVEVLSADDEVAMKAGASAVDSAPTGKADAPLPRQDLYIPHTLLGPEYTNPGHFVPLQ